MKENPSQDAHDQSKWDWIWRRNKKKIIAGSLVTIALWIYAAVDPDQTPWPILVFAFPAWFAVWYIYYSNLYNKNRRAYENWEETYRDKFSK